MNVELIDWSGSDTTVVNAARVSFDKEVGLFRPDKDGKLLTYLAQHEHFTPFTHCTITVREAVPVFVARQRFKHTIGFSYNEVSRRYVDSAPEIFYPNWRKRPEGSVKQGSGDLVDKIVQEDADDWYCNAMDTALSAYNHLLEICIAPEQARMVLPQSMYTEYYVTGSLYAFARAYKLRSDKHAQKEIQELASFWNQIMSGLYPYSWKALINAGVTDV